MSTMGDAWDDDEISVIGDKGEIGFIDYQDDMSVCGYNPEEEGPATVSNPFPFVEGKPRSVFIGEICADAITVTNTLDEPVDTWCKIYASTPEGAFSLSLMEPPKDSAESERIGFVGSHTLEDRMIQPGQTLKIWLSCKPEDIGLYTTVVHLDIGTHRVERVVFLLAEDNISHSLTARKPYFRGSRKKNFSVDAYVEGSRPVRVIDRGYRKRLPRYDIPRDIRVLVEKKQVPYAISNGLRMDNYNPYFKTLLFTEEIQLEDDMKEYTMESVALKRQGNFLTLEVPGLAEKRPSLVHGDFIFAKLSLEDGNGASKVYKGYVHRVEADEVFLKFDAQFHHQYHEGELYDVKFTYNRINMRKLYQAVDAAQTLEREFLFPSQSKKRVIDVKPFVPLHPHLNEEQTNAVKMILGCKGAPPYVIYGPPGTGKTLTLVEAILQLYKTQRNSKLLICAPSNAVADYILEKLLSGNSVKIKEHEIFRLNAASRPYSDLKGDLIQYSFFNDQIFMCPPLSALVRYRIIVSTYMSASLLYSEGIRRGHFTHIFLDEASQASEPESLIPISNLSTKNTVVVLAGDPMQLGPVIYSKQADLYCLGQSYLERLCNSGYYYSGDLNYVMKLHKNYRCHPEILHLPSKLFYQGDLVACKKDITTYMESVSFLPNKEFPVLFLGIQGCDEREGNNPSWFNRIEISKVVETIRKLTANGSILEEDIGVITPYKQQVLKLNEVLERLDMTDIKVGSVEQFQGQEKQVIIISTVRSTIKHNDFDKVHCLGFLSNPKRFNVAITRAISLLVIVGNPHIICKDINWQQLLWRCVDNGSYQGCALPNRLVCAGEDPAEPDVAEDGANPEWAQNPEWSNDWEDGNPVRVTAEAGWSNDWAEGNAVPVTGEAGWSNDWAEGNAVPVTGEAGWSNDWAEGNAVPVTAEAGWSNDWGEGNAVPVTAEAGWSNDWAEGNAVPVTGEAGWSNDWAEGNPVPVTAEAGWSNDWAEGNPVPVTAEVGWSNDWAEGNHVPVTAETGWSNDWAEGNPVPVTAEAEWSNDLAEGNPVPVMAKAEGPNNWEIENPKPITNQPERSNGWENGNIKPITDQPGHSNVWESENQKPSSDQSEVSNGGKIENPKPFPDEAKWYFEWEIENRQLIMNESKYLNGWKDDDPKPITNKAGYSLRSTAKKADWSNEWNFEVPIPTEIPIPTAEEAQPNNMITEIPTSTAKQVDWSNEWNF